MVKHNNVIPNGHFKKHWERRVKTWFNQPARKLRRREDRVKKALRVAPRPVAGSFRPVVHSPTARYGAKVRSGRGFTLEELKEAGINRKDAKTVGIAVDHRRHNNSEESLKLNVQRLKEYKSRLVVFPRNAKKPKAGDATATETAAAKQIKGAVVPLPKASSRVRSRAITQAERDFKAVRTLQAARTAARIEGVRQKMAREKAAAAEN
eukprot:c4045_g1_i1.p1 GENE.c4045_g1_i1~~c4045_g1_i1.p1  ORF type:complete len:208 (+),score=40.79 c4045_g1_i1:42-665(+)